MAIEEGHDQAPAALDDLRDDVAEVATRGMRRSEAALLDLLRELQQLHEQALERPRALVVALLGCLEARDPYTGAHCRAVHDLALLVTERLRLPVGVRDEVRAVALLHDLGKVALPDAILFKPGPLDPSERALVEQHPVLGERIVAAVPGLAEIAEGVRHEHERWDGAGYPDGIVADRIPLSARIVAACDAFHALVSDRPYRAGVPGAEALAELRAGAGKQFDLDVVDALTAALTASDGTGEPEPPPPLFGPAPGEPLTRGLQALVRVATVTGAAERLDDVLEVAAEEVLVALDAASVSVSRWERERGLLRVLLNVGELASWEEPRPRDEVYTLTDFPEVMRLLRRGEPYLHLLHDPDIPPSGAEALRRLHRGSEVGVPIVYEGQMWGELSATSAHGRPPFDERHTRLLQAIAGIVATAIGRAELFARVSRLAFEDPLTELANRRALDDRLQDALDRAGSGGPAPVSLVVADIDDFKHLNDHHGHAFGDQVLRRVGDALSSAAAELPGALVARSGGDEFCVVLAGHSLAAAEGLCRTAGALLSAGEDFAVTLAWGAASSADGARRPAELFREADAAQYAAKRAGPGQIRTSVPDPQESTAHHSGRRRLRDSGPELDLLVPEAIDAVYSLPPEASTLDRLERVAMSFAAALDAGGWLVWRIRHGERELRFERGRLGVLDPETGSREETRAPAVVRDIARHPASEVAVANGTSYHVVADDPAGDRSARRVLIDVGYAASISAGGHDAGAGYLVEVFADARTPPLHGAAAHLRAAVAAATAYRRSPS